MSLTIFKQLSSYPLKIIPPKARVPVLCVVGLFAVSFLASCVVAYRRQGGVRLKEYTWKTIPFLLCNLGFCKIFPLKADQNLNSDRVNFLVRSNEADPDYADAFVNATQEEFERTVNLLAKKPLVTFCQKFAFSLAGKGKSSKEQTIYPTYQFFDLDDSRDLFFSLCMGLDLRIKRLKKTGGANAQEEMDKLWDLLKSHKAQKLRDECYKAIPDFVEWICEFGDRKKELIEEIPQDNLKKVDAGSSINEIPGADRWNKQKIKDMVFNFSCSWQEFINELQQSKLRSELKLLLSDISQK